MYMRNPTDMSLKSPMDEWEIPANEVIMEKQLGEGAFGEVYKGIVKCPIVNPKVRPLVENAFCTPVAIKLLKCKKNLISNNSILYMHIKTIQCLPKEMSEKIFSQRLR